MITSKQFQMLKKNNVSVDAEKTKARATALFKRASTAQRSELLKLSGLSSPNTFYNSEKTGTVSPKVALSLAQVLKVSPYFITGESDAPEPCTDAILDEFFRKCTEGNEKKSKKRKGEEKYFEADEDNSVFESSAAPAVSESYQAEKPAKSANLDDVSLVKLLEALAIRAKYGGEAEQTYNRVVALLLK